MRDLPTGRVTFLFTDIEGSTRLWEEQPAQMEIALARHDALLRAVIEEYGGCVFKTVGDAFCAAFAIPEAAVRSALQIQRALLAGTAQDADGDRRPTATGPPPRVPCPVLSRLRVRMALHQGEPVLRDHDYFGPPVNRVARILSAAHGGQTLLSAAVWEQVHEQQPGGGGVAAEGVSFLAHGAHRLKDLTEPEVLFQLAHPDLPADFPPLRSLSSHPNNLPTQASTFIGRRQEMAAVRELLAGAARLVTLTGPGGGGKTRIALQIAADEIEHYPGGAWWVDLAPLREAHLVMPAVLAALGLKEEPLRTARETVADYLRKGRALLVLDNFEQVLEAAGDIAELVRACPDLRILVTSRTVLNLSVEHEYVVPGLDVDEARTLFLVRAQQVRSSFALDEDTRPVVERLCRRLDGMPLALELAAAQVRMRTVAQIEKQLEQRFRVLVSPFRDALERQRTLRATVDWSYDLLTDPERQLFNYLSVFVGSFTLEAAEAICPEEKDVFFGAARLREQSLLRTEETGDGVRFRLLETLREYGQEKLCEAGEREAVAARHARYYAAVAGRDVPARLAASEEAALAELVQDTDNFRAALDWLIARDGAADEAAALAVALAGLWERQGRFREGRAYLTRCLERQSEMQDVSCRAVLLGKAGWFAYQEQDYSAAREQAQQKLALSRDLEDATGESGALNDLALIAQAQGQVAEARELFEEALVLAQRLGDESQQAARLSNLGLLAIQEGRFAEADALLQEARTLYSRQNDPHGTAVCLCNLSELALRRRDWAEAERLASEGLHRFRRLDDRPGVAYTLANLAEAATQRGDHPVALQRIEEALGLCTESGMDWLAETLRGMRALIPAEFRAAAGESAQHGL